MRNGTLEAGLLCLPVPTEGLHIQPLMRHEILWASSKPERCMQPMRLVDMPKEPLILYDARHGEEDPTRLQLTQQAQQCGVTLEPDIEVESVDAAMSLVSRGLGDSIVPQAVAQSEHFPSNIHVTTLECPIYDTFALVRRENWELSPIAAHLADLAVSMLLNKVSGEVA